MKLKLCDSRKKSINSSPCGGCSFAPSEETAFVDLKYPAHLLNGKYFRVFSDEFIFHPPLLEKIF